MAITDSPKLYHAPETRIIDNRAVRVTDVCVHTFVLGDVEDPDLYAAQPLYAWQQSAAGQWVMEHAMETPYWLRDADPLTLGFRYQIRARLTDQDHTFWKMKFT
jgi:hypothetical protein